jgi:hypothetical protein
VKARFVLHEADNSTWHLELVGRVADTLCKLIKAGRDGISTVENPAPRWSDYVFKLRKRGIDVVTFIEKHGGDFPGYHGRYVLRSKVQRVDVGPLREAA